MDTTLGKDRFAARFILIILFLHAGSTTGEGSRYQADTSCSRLVAACAFTTISNLDFYKPVTCTEMTDFFTCFSSALTSCSHSGLQGAVQALGLFINSGKSEIMETCIKPHPDSCELIDVSEALLLCIGALYNRIIIEKESSYELCLAAGEATECGEERLAKCRDYRDGSLSEPVENLRNATLITLWDEVVRRGLCGLPHYRALTRSPGPPQTTSSRPVIITLLLIHHHVM